MIRVHPRPGRELAEPGRMQEAGVQLLARAREPRRGRRTTHAFHQLIRARRERQDLEHQALDGERRRGIGCAELTGDAQGRGADGSLPRVVHLLEQPAAWPEPVHCSGVGLHDDDVRAGRPQHVSVALFGGLRHGAPRLAGIHAVRDADVERPFQHHGETGARVDMRRQVLARGKDRVGDEEIIEDERRGSGRSHRDRHDRITWGNHPLRYSHARRPANPAPRA